MRHKDHKPKTTKPERNRLAAESRIEALPARLRTGVLEALEQMLLAWGGQAPAPTREPVIRF